MERNNKRNAISIFLSVIAFVFSIISLGVACYRTDNLGFDYLGVIVGILAILVTILMAWQLYKYSAWKDTINEVLYTALDKSTKDYTSYMMSITQIYTRSMVIDNSKSAFLFDTAIESLNELSRNGNEVLKNQGVDFFYDYLYELSIIMKDTNYMKLFPGKKDHYKYILSLVPHEYQQILLSFLDVVSFSEIKEIEKTKMSPLDGGFVP